MLINLYWFNKEANKEGNELFGFLVDKDLEVANNGQPSRNDRINDLTIIINSLKEKSEGMESAKRSVPKYRPQFDCFQYMGKS